MDLNRFIREREAGWKELEERLDGIASRGLAAQRRGDLRRLVALYRQASSDLIEAQAGLRNADLLGYLNALVGRAYAEIYTARGLDPSGVVDRVRGFLASGFPALIHRHRRLVLFATAIFVLGTALGFVGVALDPAARDWLVPEQHRDLDPSERVAGIERTGHEPEAVEAAAFSSFLFTHNIRVAFAAFALGITLGIGTVAVLFANGVMLGALAADYALAGESVFFWAWILPHGVPEIGSILIAGAAGLLIGRSLLFPGHLRLKASFARGGTAAVSLVLGTVPFFVAAGLIEGSLSQIHEPKLPYGLKLAFAAIEAALIAAYLRLGRRRRGDDGEAARALGQRARGSEAPGRLAVQDGGSRIGR